ncbi:hypothetical protein HD554DRAFT_2090028 [Boletus coccyginus]|nr:hypothetical protein HD554DRAFT_2090028 [Boletus coccyginus]
MFVESSTPLPDRAFPVDPQLYKPPRTSQRILHSLSFVPSQRVCVLSFALAHMQDPKKEITSIIRKLCTTRDANELEETVKRHFTTDASFSHPLCTANSRNEILGLFQWYRLASPETYIDVSSVMYDPELNVLVVEVRERLNVWFIPLPGKTGRMVVRLQLRKINGLHYIAIEEDMTHPIDLIGFVASPLLPLAALYLRLGCLLSNLGACVFRTVGLNSGLRGGTVSYTGLLEAAGLARTTGVKYNGNALKE